MLSLDDDRWASLSHAYGNPSDCVGWLRALRQQSPDLSRVLGDYDYFGSLCHQYSVYSATYAAIPHVIDIAGMLPPESRHRIDLLVFVGMCVACSKLPDAPDIPDFLHSGYQSAINAAIPLIAESLPHVDDENEQASNLRHMFAALAACKEFAALAFILADMDCSIECPHCDGFIDAFECNLNLLAVHD